MAERLSGGTGRRRIDNTLRRLLLTDHQMQCATTAGSRWYMPGYVCEYCQELAAGEPVVIDSATLMCVLLHAGLSGIDDYAFGAATAASNSCSTSTAPCRNGLSRKKFRSTNFIETGQLLWRGGEHNARKAKFAHCAACAHKRATTGTPW